MQKTGQIERTVDPEFAEEEGRYRTCVLYSSQSHYPSPDDKLRGMSAYTQNGEGDERFAEGCENLLGRYEGCVSLSVERCTIGC